MNAQIVFVAAGIVASICLGTLSNWLYDLLRTRGVFPDKPTVKASIIIFLASLPFILLILLSEASDQTKAAFLELMQMVVPLWLVLVILSLVVLISNIIYRVRTNRLLSILDNSEKQVQKLERQLESAERRLDQCLKPGPLKPVEPIIKPK